jgi:iron complex outermembrane receptor protein
MMLSMTTKHRFSLVLLPLLMGVSVTANEITLESITVEETKESIEDETLSYSSVKSTERLAQQSHGETLGDYLSHELCVESASYGPAVGRPTVRGMEGYRVGIAQGGVMLNDLSAMSQDHAVGLNARLAKRIELIKGPASLLYGSYSGGIVRTLGEEHEVNLPSKGFSFDGSLWTNSNTGFGTGSLKSAYATEQYALNLNYYKHEAKAYSSGGEVVLNSDVSNEQLHGVVGWKVDPNHTVKLYADTMSKEYGIANTTPERTDIVMEQERYGVVWHMASLGMFKEIMTELQSSDYHHFEREGGRYDGLFDQQQQSLSSEFKLEVGSNSEADFRLELLSSALRVCHEHGECKHFKDALRTEAEDGHSLLGYYNDRGIAFSHGHPMPDTEEKKMLMAFNFKHYYGSSDELSLALNVVARKLTVDPSNIQETWLMPKSLDSDYYSATEDVATSLSLGWWHMWSEDLSTQTSLAYIERLPSTQELLWNGFHHATESYILGNRDVDKERSVNFDIDTLFKHSKAFTTRLSFYWYRFENYIFQSPLVNSEGTIVHDPFHLSPVWQIEGKAATIVGFGLEERYSKRWEAHTLTTILQLNALQGKLDNGDYIPRMAPYNASLGLQHSYKKVTSDLGVKWVDESRNIADNETSTEGYTMLNFSTRYHYALPKGDSLEFWLKAENLTDVVARDHTSFLKETAPLAGRSIEVGVHYKF